MNTSKAIGFVILLFLSTIVPRASEWQPRYQALLVTAFDNDRQQWLHDTTTLFMDEQFDRENLYFYDGRNKREILEGKALKKPKLVYFPSNDYQIPPFINYVKYDYEAMYKTPSFQKFFFMVMDTFERRFQIKMDDYFSKKIKLIPEVVIIYPKASGGYEVFSASQYSDYKYKNPSGNRFQDLENNRPLYENFLLNNNLKFNDYGLKSNRGATNLRDYNKLRYESGIFNLKIYSRVFGTYSTDYQYFYPQEEAIVSAFMVSIKESNPEDPFSYYYIIDGVTYPRKHIYFPSKKPIYLYQRFRVPEKRGKLDILLCTSDRCQEIEARVVDLREDTPPNTRSDELQVISAHKSAMESYKDVHKYTEYRLGSKVREGHYSLETIDQTCRFIPEGSGKIFFDRDIPKETDGDQNSLKSGYGFGIEIPKTASDNNESCIGAQGFRASFPEFDFTKYSRLLEEINGSYQFKQNPFHPRRARVHFTPLNFPNKDYELEVEHLGVFTPLGRMSSKEKYAFPIEGNLWDDYQIQFTSSWSKMR